eukprot:Sspe_Gene.93167::Locus_65869_Transcript_1_1_Confidence_1.000_Length_3781::g.93167::m.93167/K18408/TDRD9; ATP-dependent RNA helicase TDRD9
MAQLNIDTDSEEEWSDVSEGNVSDGDEADLRAECPFKKVGEVVLARQRLVVEMEAITTQLETNCRNLTWQEIESLREQRDELEDMEVRYQRWQIKLQKEEVSARASQLSVHKQKKNLMEAIEGNRVVVVTGPTACGKSTQIPQYLLDSAPRKRILVCQTRRISTTSVAARVALERGEPLGKTVGFVIGGCNATSKATRLTFVTTGVLQQMLTSGDLLRQFAYVVIDEVHERTLETDISLVCLRDMMEKRNTRTHLVIMSATMQGFKRKLQQYFEGVNGGPVPVVAIPGYANYRTVYLEEIELEGLTAHERRAALRPPKRCQLTPARMHLAVRLIKELHLSVLDSGASILVFLPGLADITEMYSRLEMLFGEDGGDSIQLLCLHSSISVDEQHRVFRPTQGRRMVVLSTNIAESAITLCRLGAVIDFCLQKRSEFDPATRTASIKLHWVSRAMATQRAGRCGRSFAGVVYRMVSHSEFDAFEDTSPPEVLTAPLVDTCLRALNMRWVAGGARGLLSRLLDPPADDDEVVRALNSLVDLRCASKGDDYALTYLGRLATVFPVGLHAALFVIFGYMYGCFEDAAVCAAALGRGKSVIINPWRQPVVGAMLRLSYAGPSLSDEICTVNAYRFWQSRRPATDEKSWCAQRGLSLPALRELHDAVLQLFMAASRAGMCEPPMAAEIARRMEQKKTTVELLAATDVDEQAMCALGTEDPSTADRLADALLVRLTLSASEPNEGATEPKGSTTQLQALAAASDERLMQWLLEDSLRETEICHLRPSDQFAFSACLAAVYHHQAFFVGSAPHAGGVPVSHVENLTPEFYLDLELSHTITNTDKDSEKATRARDEMVRRLSALVPKVNEDQADGPTLPIKWMVMRTPKRRVEMYLETSAVGYDQDKGWFCQAGLHRLFAVRVATRLLDRRIRVRAPLEVEDVVSAPTRTSDGRLLLPGAKRHRRLGSGEVSVSKARVHSSIAGEGRLCFTHISRTKVQAGTHSVSYPFVVPREGCEVWGVATELHSVRRTKLIAETATVMVGRQGMAEVVCLALDPAIDISRIETREDSGRTVVTIDYTVRRNGVIKPVRLSTSEDLVSHCAAVRQGGVKRLEDLYERYLEHVKRQAEAQAKKREARKARREGDARPDVEWKFDPSKLVQNTMANPLLEHYRDPTEATRAPCPPSDAEADTTPFGSVRTAPHTTDDWRQVAKRGLRGVAAAVELASHEYLELDSSQHLKTPSRVAHPARHR